MAARLTVVLVAIVAIASACEPAQPSRSPGPSLTAEGSLTPTPLDLPGESTLDAECMPQPVADPGGLVLYGAYGPMPGSDGGTLTIGDRHAATQFNPLELESAGDLELGAATWSGLDRFDYEFRLTEDLAAGGIPTTSNGRVAVPGSSGSAMDVTWCLRRGLRWSDGAALTCSDFDFTRTWLRDIAPASVRARYGDLQSIDCRTPDVLIARYGTVFSGYATQMVPPLPRHYLEKIPLADLRAGVGFNAADLPALPVSGPFRFTTVTPSEIRLARNDYYRGGYRSAPAHLDQLVLRWYSNDAAAIAGYRAGEIDLAANLDQTDPQQLAATDLAEHISSVPSLVELVVVMNWSQRQDAGGSGGCSLSGSVTARGDGCPAADPAIRKALSEAIDLDAVATGLVGAPAYRGWGVAPDSYFFTDVPAPVFDPAQAREDLQQVGWTGGAGGTRRKGGLQAVVELCISDEPRSAAAAARIRRDAASIGIDVVVHSVPEVALLAPYERAGRTSPCAVSRGNFDLALLPVATSIEPVDYRQRYHSAAFEPAGRNDARVADPTIDAALDMAVQTADFVVIKHAMAAFQQAAAATALEIPLAFEYRVDLFPPQTGPGGFVNLTSGAASPLTWDAADWAISP
jgi:ABC-type transport system substrate-binding protein